MYVEIKLCQCFHQTLTHHSPVQRIAYWQYSNPPPPLSLSIDRTSNLSIDGTSKQCPAGNPLHSRIQYLALAPSSPSKRTRTLYCKKLCNVHMLSMALPLYILQHMISCISPEEIFSMTYFIMILLTFPDSLIEIIVVCKMAQPSSIRTMRSAHK